MIIIILIPPKSYPPTPPPSRAFKFPLTLLFTSTALQLGFRRGCDLLKLRFIFFPFEGKKRKEKKFSRLCPQREGLWSRAFCSKKILPVRFFLRTSCFFHLPDFFFLFSVRSDRHEGGLHERAGGVRLAALTWGVWVKFWKWHQPSLKKKRDSGMHSRTARNPQLPQSGSICILAVVSKGWVNNSYYW